MNGAVERIGKQFVDRVPEIAALIAVVAGFLIYMDRKDVTSQIFIRETAAMATAQLSRRDDVQDKVFERMAAAIEKSTNATIANTKVTTDLSTRLMLFMENDRRRPD